MMVSEDPTKHQVTARRWRPQSFLELVGQDHVSTTLLNALRAERLPQALLFTGVRGTGKTSTARILAKALRCPNVKDFIPCGECRDCTDIANSRSVDVVEIDGASNNGVDAIRELRDSVGYRPASGAFKVYIIDEVHMLSTAAFNALLKTLEEPPQHVIFILATTEVQKIPNTILSRCQRFDFRRIPSRVIADHLKKICDTDQIPVEAEALWAIARQADGSMRDSQSLLDHVVNFANRNLTLAKVSEVLGLTDHSLILKTVTALLHRRAAEILQLLEEVKTNGVDLKVFSSELLEAVRNVLVAQTLSQHRTSDSSLLNLDVLDLPDSELAELTALSQVTSAEDLHMLFDMLLKGINDLNRSPDPRLVFEMMLLRIAGSPKMSTIRELLLSVPQSAPAPQPTLAAPLVQSSEALSQKSESVPQTTSSGYTLESFVKQVKPGAPIRPASAAVAAIPASLKPKPSEPPPPEVADPNVDSKDPWHVFVAKVRKSNGLLGAMLENTHILSQSESVLLLGVPKKVGFMMDKMKDPENIRRIEQFIETLWEKKLKVELKVAEPSTAPVATPEALTPKAKEEHSKAKRQQEIESAIADDPLVKSAQNVFKTQLRSIRPAQSSN